MANGEYKREYIRKNAAPPAEPIKVEPIPQTKPIESNYYRINIAWDSNINYHIIEQFFNELCINADRKLDDHSMSYIYFGGDEKKVILISNNNEQKMQFLSYLNRSFIPLEVFQQIGNLFLKKQILIVMLLYTESK